MLLFFVWKSEQSDLPLIPENSSCSQGESNFRESQEIHNCRTEYLECLKEIGENAVNR